MTAKKAAKYWYYPGCSALATGMDYEASTQSVARAVGLNLVELDDWNCCGASYVASLDRKQGLIVAARNLAVAEREKHDLVTACSGCYLALSKANKHLGKDLGLFAEIRSALRAGGMDYKGGVKVRHILEVVVNDLGEEGIRPLVRRPLNGLKVASYYGCQIGRPYGDADDQEFPQTMEKLVSWLGAEVVPFGLKARCCGTMLMLTKPEAGKQMGGRILRNAVESGAQCIATACPLCEINLECFQSEIGSVMGASCGVPVLYFTQLLGYALGLSSNQLELGANFTPIETLLREAV